MASAPLAGDPEGSQLAPLPCLRVSELGLRLTDRAFHDVRRLANILSRVNLDSRREDLLDYIRLNRARFIKAYAIISWLAGSHGELVASAGNALTEARSQREQIDTVSLCTARSGLVVVVLEPPYDPIPGYRVQYESL